MDRYDSVVMLTWSNWKSEPRSNRYHYASRFARTVPVLFVQPDSAPSLEEPTEIAGVTLMHVGLAYTDDQLAPVARALASRGLARPLLWSYNPFYRALDRHFPGAERVFHATEDYFSGSTFLNEPAGAARYAYRRQRFSIQRHMIEAVCASHRVVCVSPGVSEGITRHCAYQGMRRVLNNGCDYAFWRAFAQPERRNTAKRIAIFQGGINERLDTELIVEVTRRLADWEFRFCGSVSGSYAGWQAIVREPNVRFLGMLNAEAVREALYQADVGLMPYRQLRSLTGTLMPLKAFEYAACGLPVVTVPIDSIAHLPGIFRPARTAAEFAAALVEEATTRDDPARQAARLAAAKAQDYDQRFAELEEWLRAPAAPKKENPSARMRLRILAARELLNDTLLKITSLGQP